MSHLTEAQRQVLLDRAIEAVRALHGIGPDTDPGEARRRREIASMAVTDAVTRGEHVHTLISGRTELSGLRIVGLIADPEARTRAYGVERNAAKEYLRLVQEATGDHIRQRMGEEGYGSRAAIARDLGVTPVTVDAWVRESERREELTASPLV